MKKQKVIVFILIILILSMFLFLIGRKHNFKIQEDFILFKLFSFEQDENSNTLVSENLKDSTYLFQVNYKNMDFKNIRLADTTKQKIAPGTEGNFEMILQSNKKINYRIQFKSISSKPENLYFQIKGKDRKYTNLEEIEPMLQGELKGNKRIEIYWKWEYEKDEKQNLQDTKDGENIRPI